MELWDILDIHGNKIGGTVERGRPIPPGEYHLVVDIWIKNSRGEYLISRRSDTKVPDPGLWEPTCGCAVAGDSSLAAALREVQEELGLTLDPAGGRRIKRFIIPGSPDIVDVWLFTQDADIQTVVLQPGETDDAQWAGIDKIRQLVAEGKFLSGRRLPYMEELFTGRLSPLRLSAACLKTQNIDAMVRFYTQVFGYAPEVDGGVDFRFYDAQLVVFKLMDENAEPTRSAALIYNVTDADAEYDRLHQLGLAKSPPTDKPWGVRSFMIADPDGNTVSFVMRLEDVL